MAKLIELERRAEQSEFPPLRSLTQYWRIDLRDRNREETERALAHLRDTPEVEMVEEEVERIPATVLPGDDDYNASQHYQDAAPTGIDARWMWTQPDGEGAGVGVVDIEGGWRVTHEDLAGDNPTLIHGAQSTNADWVNHGTRCSARSSLLTTQSAWWEPPRQSRLCGCRRSSMPRRTIRSLTPSSRRSQRWTSARFC